jgi:hypothetical protein
MAFSVAWADPQNPNRGIFINATQGAQKANDAAFRHRSAEIDVDMLNDKNIVLNLFDDTEFDVERVHVSEGARGEFTWSGKIVGPIKGTVNITVYGDAVAGTIQTDGQLFEINPGRNGRVTIEEIDLDNLPSHVNPIFPDAEPAGEDSTSESSSSFAPAISADFGDTIDLMVMYTKASRERYESSGGIVVKIMNAVASLNNANIRSDIHSQYRLVHTSEVNYTETGNMIDALYGITFKDDGIMENVHALRDTYGADIVSLVTEDSNYCGIAWGMRNLSSSFETRAFNTTYSGCMSNHTMSHEIGHNEGCMHDRANSSSPGTYPYSYGYRDTTEGFRTIMSFSCSGGACPRIPNFSNPNVTHNGVSTGIDHDTDPNNSADNARSKNNTASTVANWRQAVDQTIPSVPSGLLVSVISSNELLVSWSDNAGNENGYYVERSSVGSGWQRIATTSPGAESYIDNGLNPSTTYHYRAQAFNGVGTSDYSESDSATTDVEPPNQGPTADFSFSTSGLTATFGDSSTDSDGNILSRSWNFGDSSGSESTNAVHSYGAYITYTVTLTVTDDDGATDSFSQAVTLTAPSPNPDAPSNLTANVQSSGKGRNKVKSVTLTWADNSSTETSFEIERCKESGRGKNKTCIFGMAGTTTTDTHIFSETPGIGTFKYRVKAKNGTYTSGYSNVVKL